MTVKELKTNNMGYTPYKMQADNNDPMTKNYGPVAPGKMRAFGIDDSENPDNMISMGKFKDDSPAKGLFGAIGSLFGGNKTSGGSGGSFGAAGDIIEKAKAAKLEKQQGAFAAGGGDKLEHRVTELEGQMQAASNNDTTNAAQPNVVTPNMANKMQKPNFQHIGTLGGNANPFNAFSDVRLKEKIEKTGKSPSGIPTYEFNYIGDNNRYSGVMAQDLIEMNIDAVSMDDSGFYTVNYNNIDVDMHLIN